MATDEKDNDTPGDKKAPPPKQVVVTHYGKRKKQDDIPAEIVPTEPTHIISSPVDIGLGSGATLGAKPSSSSPQETPRQPPVPPSASPTPVSAFKSAASEEIPRASQNIPPFAAEASESRETFSYAGGPPSNVPPTMTGDGDEPPPPPRRQGVFWKLVLTTAVIVLGYYTYSSAIQLSELQKQTNDDQASMASLNEQAKKSLTQIIEENTNRIADQKSFSELKQQIEAAQTRLVDLTGSSDWVLAEANYLAFMANERIRTAQDITTALTQLTAADERLKMLGNPALLWVRQVLAKDIAKLRTFPMVNRQEIWEQLGLMSLELNQLHFKRLSDEASLDKEEAPKVDEQTSAWKKALWQSWLEFKSLVRVTRVEKNPIPAALSEQEQAQVLRGMQLFCEQAKWAILQGDSKIYKNSLSSLKSWIKDYFLQDKLASQFLTQIQQLEQQQVDIALPDISESMQALSKAMLEISEKPINPHQTQKGGGQ